MLHMLRTQITISKRLVRYSDDLAKLMNEHKVNVYQTSDAILAEQLKGWDKIVGSSLKKMLSLRR